MLNYPEYTSDFKVVSNHYYRYKEYVKLFSEIVLNAYRVSIAYTIIISNCVGKINKNVIEFYKNIIDELNKYNIEQIVTRYNFDLPYELEKKGRWSNKCICRICKGVI